MRLHYQYTLWILSIIFGGGLSEAYALVVVKEIKNLSEDTVQIQFDQPVNDSELSVEYLRDIIQVSVKNASIYPAKIYSVKGKDLVKVFAYQYSPSLVRARLSVADGAESYQNRFAMVNNGKVVTLKILPKGAADDAIQVSSAQAVKKEAPAVVSPKIQAPASPDLTGDEKKLLADILGKKEQKSPQYSMVRTFAKLMAVLAGTSLAILLIVFGFRRVRLSMKRRSGNEGAVAQWLSKVSKGKLSIKKNMIQVEASHFLGPKKSIVVVRIGNERLVLGIANDSINLISKVRSGTDQYDGPEDRLGSGRDDFDGVLDHTFGRPEEEPMLRDSVRERIKRKINEMKTV